MEKNYSFIFFIFQWKENGLKNFVLNQNHKKKVKYILDRQTLKKLHVKNIIINMIFYYKPSFNGHIQIIHYYRVFYLSY